MVAKWKNGGYSDDLIASSLCQAKGLVISSNPSSIVLQELPEQTTVAQYWNYVRRQTFVLDTYTSTWHRRLNMTLISIHVYLSCFFVLAVAQNLWLYAKSALAILVFLAKVPQSHSEVYQYR